MSEGETRKQRSWRGWLRPDSTTGEDEFVSWRCEVDKYGVDAELTLSDGYSKVFYLAEHIERVDGAVPSKDVESVLDMLEMISTAIADLRDAIEEGGRS